MKPSDRCRETWAGGIRLAMTPAKYWGIRRLWWFDHDTEVYLCGVPTWSVTALA